MTYKNIFYKVGQFYIEMMKVTKCLNFNIQNSNKSHYIG